ncbi:hypothetical protein ASE38_02140 [Cellulomonas sp. Root930]|nr:hypothetical protein ASE38_02140 [Cellulomonas sp. Root930]
MSAFAVGLLLLFARVNVMYFVAASTASAVIGIGILVQQGVVGPGVAITYAISACALFIGYGLGALRGGRERAVTRTIVVDSGDRPRRDRAIKATVWFAGLLSLYHLARIGFPVFSSTIEVDRFDFTSSGLFGIPGRMYLYGVPLAWIIASCGAQAAEVQWRAYSPWRTATFFLVASALLSGFKSGLIAQATLMLIMAVFLTGHRFTVWSAAARHWWVAVLAAAYGFVVALSYSTYRTAGAPVWQQLFDRLTVVGAEPKAIAIQSDVVGAAGNMIVSDFSYFIAKYSGSPIPGSFTFERAVSAQIIGADPSSDSWTVPVTVGGIPELLFSLGWPFATLLLLAIGYAIGSLRPQGRSFGYCVLAATIVYAFYLWITRGGVAYYAINVAAVLCILAVPYATSWLLWTRNARRTPHSAYRNITKNRPSATPSEGLQV